MKALIAWLLIAALGLSGCSMIVYSIEQTDERTTTAFSDPIRRVHLGVQVSRLASAASVALTCVALLSPTIVGILVCPFVAVLSDFITFEYVLEPISKERVKRGQPSLVGPYWETGPRADEGEFFNDGCTSQTHTCRPPEAR